MSELKPCPFCGGKGEVIGTVDSIGEPWIYVGCGDSVKHKGPFGETVSEAIAAWNNRPGEREAAERALLFVQNVVSTPGLLAEYRTEAMRRIRESGDGSSSDIIGQMLLEDAIAAALGNPSAYVPSRQEPLTTEPEVSDE